MKYHKGVASVILDLLQDGQVRKTSEIINAKASRSAFNQALQKLLTQGEIEKVGYGKYRIAVDTEPVDKPPAVDKPPSKDDKPRKDEQTEDVDGFRKDGNGHDTERAVGKVTRKDDKPPAVDNDPYKFVFYPAIKIL